MESTTQQLPGSPIHSAQVRHGMEKKMARGWRPGFAPLGYRNVTEFGVTRIEPDEEKAKFIRDAFEMLSLRKASLRRVLAILTERGFRGRNGEPVCLGSFFYIVSNPYYCGMVRRKIGGEVTQGAHPPLITKRLFDEVQENLKGRRLCDPD